MDLNLLGDEVVEALRRAPGLLAAARAREVPEVAGRGAGVGTAWSSGMGLDTQMVRLILTARPHQAVPHPCTCMHELLGLALPQGGARRSAGPILRFSRSRQ